MKYLILLLSFFILYEVVTTIIDYIPEENITGYTPPLLETDSAQNIKILFHHRGISGYLLLTDSEKSLVKKCLNNALTAKYRKRFWSLFNSYVFPTALTFFYSTTEDVYINTYDGYSISFASDGSYTTVSRYPKQFPMMRISNYDRRLLLDLKEKLYTKQELYQASDFFMSMSQNEEYILKKIKHYEDKKVKALLRRSEWGQSSISVELSYENSIALWKKLHQTLENSSLETSQNLNTGGGSFTISIKYMDDAYFSLENIYFNRNGNTLIVNTGFPFESQHNKFYVFEDAEWLQGLFGEKDSEIKK